MNIDSTSNVGNLEAFLRLVGNARVRNAGFETPVKRVNSKAPSHAAETQRRLKPAGNFGNVYTARGAHTSMQTEKPKQILGMRFDAYA